MVTQHQEQSVKVSLKVKAIAFISLLVLVIGGGLSWYFLNQTRHVLTDELQKRALSLAKNLAHNSTYGILIEDKPILHDLIKGILQEDSVLSVVITDAQGRVLAQETKPEPDTATVPSDTALASRITSPSIQTQRFGHQEVYRAVAPVETIETATSESEQGLDTAIFLLGAQAPEPRTTSETVRLGSVQIWLSPENMQANARQIFATGLGWTLGVILVGVLVAIMFYNSTLKPVQAMARAASNIAAGDLSQRVEARARDEIGVLATAFNDMSASLEQRLTELSAAYQQIEQLNIGLEARVRERTEELQLRQEQLQEVNRQLEIANRHKSEFMASMSHELRTPLNAVIGFSEVLLERMFGDLNDKQAEYLDDILDSGKYLLSLINDILDLSKIEAGKLEMELGTFDLKPLLENSLVMFKERAQTHGVDLSLEIADDVKPLSGDARKVKQIMFNLLSNAVKFTPDGGQVGIRALSLDEAMQIAVWDTGVGIAPDDQQRIFDEFQQVGTGLTEKTEGTGLGLTLTKKFVELHGGTIWVESTPSQGSTFTFTLPLSVQATSPDTMASRREKTT